MLTIENFKDVTGVEIPFLQLKALQEILEGYLGYKLEESEKIQIQELMSNNVKLWYPNIKKINSIKIMDREIEKYELEDNHIVLDFFKRDFFNFPYETENLKINIKYISGYKLEELPASIYYAILEFKAILEEDNNELTSYAIDTIKETYKSTDRFQKINLLLKDLFL